MQEFPEICIHRNSWTTLEANKEIIGPTYMFFRDGFSDDFSSLNGQVTTTFSRLWIQKVEHTGSLNKNSMLDWAQLFFTIIAANQYMMI